MFKFDDFLSTLSRRNLGGVSPSGAEDISHPGGSAGFDEAAYARPGGMPDGDGNDVEFPGEESTDMSPQPIENSSTPRPLRNNPYADWLGREKKLR